MSALSTKHSPHQLDADPTVSFQFYFMSKRIRSKARAKRADRKKALRQRAFDEAKHKQPITHLAVVGLTYGNFSKR